MSRIFLVALREYRHISTTRSFWVTLMIIPLILAATIAVSQYLRPEASVAYTIVDKTGVYATAIDHRIELDYQRQVMAELSAYAQRWNVRLPATSGLAGAGWSGDPQTHDFIAAGGADAMMRAIGPRLPADAPPFKPPARPFVRVAPPQDAQAAHSPESFGASIASMLKTDVETPAGKRPLALAVYIPEHIGMPGTRVRMWTNGRPNGALIETVRAELDRAARLRALGDSGLSESQAARIDSMTVPVAVTQPPAGAGRQALTIRSALPLAMTYLLLITAMITGGMMLQGVVEERSNKLLEAILACIKPSEFMYGKLLGLIAVGGTITLVWAGCALGAAFSTQGIVADIIKPSLAALDQHWMYAAILFYFLAGYVIIAMLFLTIGSLCDSMQDAQAYLMPVMMGLMLPVMFMMNLILRNPSSNFLRIFSWIPFYTPFAMLARLGSGVSLVEVLATMVMLAAFVAGELFLLGRIFQANLLSTGQPPKLRALLKLMGRSQS